MLGIVALLISAGAAAAQSATAPLDTLRAYALALVNQDRAQQGRAPMVATAPLTQAAQRHADDMAARRYLAHVGPDGETAYDRYTTAGGDRWQDVAENIGLCADCGPALGRDDVNRLHAGWMSSPPHRDQMLSPRLTQFGFGLASDADGKVYAVQMLAGPGDEEAATIVTPDQQVARFLVLVNRDRVRRGVRKIEPKASLIQAADRALAATDDPLHSADLVATIRRSLAARWHSVTMIVGLCAGCGTELADADIDSFYMRWMNNPEYQAKLMNPDFVAAGFAMRATENGRKVALSLFAAP
jgi:uncharacterized protein YkwD